MSDKKKSKSTPPSHSRKSSASYKADLEKLFSSGGKVPERFENVMSRLEPEEGSPEAEWAEAVEGLRRADSFRDFIDAINAFRKAGHKLPDDEDLLIRMLDHPGERVLSDVLAHLLDLNRRRSIQRLTPLKSRLPTIKTMTDDPRIHEMVEALEKITG